MTVRTLLVATLLGALLLLARSAPAGLAEQSPSRDLLAYWRIGAPSAARPAAANPAPWLERLLADTAVNAVNLTDKDPAAQALARCAIAVATRGHTQTGVILRSTPEDLAQAAAAAIDDEKAATARLEAFQAKQERERAERQATDAAASSGTQPAPAPAPAPPPAPTTTPPADAAPTDPAAADPAAPDAATNAAPAPRTRPKAIVLEIAPAGEPAEVLALLATTLGGPLSTDAAPAATIADVPIHAITRDGWPRPLLWAQSSGRILLATDARALAHALTPPPEDLEDPLRIDWSGARRTVLDAQPDAQRLATLFLNINALRHEEPYSFSLGTAARLLATWRLSNTRSLAIHFGTRDVQTPDGNARLVLADLTWSARSSAPGQIARAPLTFPEFPSGSRAVFVPGADAVIVLPPNYRAVMDWIVQAYFAAMGEDLDRVFSASTEWRSWLTTNRPRVSSIIQGLGSRAVVGLFGFSSPDAPPVFPIRFATRSGSSLDGLTSNLARALDHLGMATARPDAASPSTVWSLPFENKWLAATAAWSPGHSRGSPVLVGALIFDTAAIDPAAAVRRHLVAVEPLPIALPPEPAPAPTPPPATTPESAPSPATGATPTTPAAPATP